MRHLFQPHSNIPRPSVVSIFCTWLMIRSLINVFKLCRCSDRSNALVNTINMSISRQKIEHKGSFPHHFNRPLFVGFSINFHGSGFQQCSISLNTRVVRWNIVMFIVLSHTQSTRRPGYACWNACQHAIALLIVFYHVIFSLLRRCGAAVVLKVNLFAFAWTTTRIFD